MHFAHLAQPIKIPAINHKMDHESRNRGWIMTQYHTGVITTKNNQSMLTSHQIKNTALEISHFVGRHIEVCARIPVFTGPGIIVQHTTVGIVERAFQSRAGFVFLIVLEDCVRHAYLPVSKNNYTEIGISGQPWKISENHEAFVHCTKYFAYSAPSNNATRRANQMTFIKRLFTSFINNIMEYQQIRAARIVKSYSWIR
jgi:hypothetical protein